VKEILGYRMKVASLDNVLQGKVWAYMDNTRRRSKRQKDLADISRIIETYPELTTKIPQKIKDQLQDI
jgi:GTP-dependent phosphoenolpyruvate carboxykinase